MLMQCNLVFMPGRETTDALFVVRRMQEEREEKSKLHMCVTWILRRYLLEFHEK